MQTFTKHPDEIYPIAVEFVNSLPTGTEIESGVVTATNQAETVVTASVIENTSITSTKVTTTVKGGTVGDRIELKFAATLDNGAILVEMLVMKIDENL